VYSTRLRKIGALLQADFGDQVRVEVAMTYATLHRAGHRSLRASRVEKLLVLRCIHNIAHRRPDR